uniref:Uncharacterized protein n=1 Tax=Branchiostoma floridae TaxID=7739 RepID=C3XZK8_BRAFL|eukprot:XP_002610519.1 hypothetical protein BRAFLDRAFT_65684 [Branchiostoma floridae]
MADWDTFSELQGGEKVQELGTRIEDRQATTVDDTTEGRKDIEEEEIEEEIEIEEEEFQRAEETSVDAGEGEEDVMLMLDDTYEDDFEEDDDEEESDDDEEESEKPEADQETSRAETRKRKHDDDDSDDDNGEDYIDDKDDKKDEAAMTVPGVEDVRNYVETLVGNAVRNLEAEVAARHRQIQESGEGQELTEAGEAGEKLQGEEEEEQVVMEESSSEGEATRSGQGDTGTPDPRVLRAMEFENLARMCVQRKKPQLALEYCGKVGSLFLDSLYMYLIMLGIMAVKAYQTVLGDDHPATTQCLDYFTVIYAEAGRKEYSDAMGQFQSGQEETKGQLDGTSTLQEGTTDLQQEEGATAGETSEVRRRAPGSVEKEEVEEAGQVHSEQERGVQDLQAQTDDVTWLVLLLVFLVTLVLTLVGTYLYCQSDRTSSFCNTWRSDLNYYYMSLKYRLHGYLPAGWGRG